jgi:Exportin 1-like protein
MDDNQQDTVLRSIALSSGFIHVSNQNDRQVAFQVLEDFKKYDGSISLCIGWLLQERLGLGDTDITVPTKLYALTIIDKFLQTSYTKLGETERLQLRHAVLTASRQLAPAPIVNEGRILGNKLASILAALMVRDFPQRWTTFFADVFSPMQQSGLWCNEGGGGVHIMGVKICLECLRLVTEDTTDSDFNAKVRTA